VTNIPVGCLLLGFDFDVIADIAEEVSDVFFYIQSLAMCFVPFLFFNSECLLLYKLMITIFSILIGIGSALLK